MAWIETIGEEEAQGRLAELYRTLIDPDHGGVDNILKVHSLDVASLEAHLAIYRNAMRPTKTLPKVERELIAVVVSGINQCHY